MTDMDKLDALAAAHNEVCACPFDGTDPDCIYLADPASWPALLAAVRELDALRAALERITTVADRKPAHRGKVVSHEVEDLYAIHAPGESCFICAALHPKDGAS